MKRIFKIFILALVFGLCMFLLDRCTPEDISYNTLITSIQNGEVEKVFITENSTIAKVTMCDGKEFEVSVPSVENLATMITEEIKSGSEVEFEIEEIGVIKSMFSKVLDFLSIFAIGSFIVVFVISLFVESYKSYKKDNDNEENDDEFSLLFGNKKFAKEATSDVKFSDVAGIDEEKQQLQEIVDFLKDPQKYSDMGAQVPKGILLTGAPGTGKTLLAQAIAGEAGVPFYQVTGSSFEEKFVGVGSSRVRSLFKNARANAPSIIFIDEFDTIGMKRYTSKNYGEQTLNQLLAEMQGFDNSTGVIVIAATNHAEVLDEAITRPGRFDRKIYIPMPDVVAREKILTVHAKSKKLSSDVSLAEVALKTVGFSGADLKNLLNEAAILAVNRNAEYIEENDIDEAFARVIVGLEKKNKKITTEDKYVTAVHEAGHAIVSIALRKDVESLGISIVPRGNAGGYNLFNNNEKLLYSREDAIFDMAVSYGGKAAEELILNIKSTGPISDLEHASKIAYAIVNRYAMNGSLLTLVGDSNFDSLLIKENLQETSQLCDEVYEISKNVILQNKDVLLELADLLMQKENLTADDVRSFRESHEIDYSPVNTENN